MSSIDRVSISEVDSSITTTFWSLSCEHVGVFSTNPAKERRTAEVKENLSMSKFCCKLRQFFVVKKGIKCFQIKPAPSLKINLE